MAHREIVDKLDLSISSHEDEGYRTLSVPLLTDSIQTRPKRSMMSAERYGEPSTSYAELKPEKEGRLSMTTGTSLATTSTSSSVESLNTLRENPKLNSALTPFNPPSENNHTQKSSLSHAKEWNFVQRLLSFLTIILPIKMPLTVTSLARAGFIAYREKSGSSYACAHCNLVIGEFPSAYVDNPESYHRSVSPNCPFFCESHNQEAVEPTADYGTQNPDSGFKGSMEISVSESDTAQGFSSSLITRTLSAVGDTGSSDASSVEGANYDEVVTQSLEAALIDMGKDTEHYTMQRQLKHTMCVERNRRRTFKQHHLLDTKITKYYAASGLYLTELRGDLTLRCAWCKFTYSFTKEMASDRELALTILNKHIGDPQSNSPPCDFISGRNHTLKNIPDLFNKECWKSLTKPDIAGTDLSDQLSNLGISNQSAKYPAMAISERRRDSFLTYISETTQQIDGLVEAGYFYSNGGADAVVCFMCGLVSSNWSISETPWQRHVRSAPTCQHVIVQKGQEFIQSTIEQYGEYRESKNADKINNVTTRMLRPRMDTHVVQQAIKLGIKRDTVKTVVSNRIKAGERDFRYLEEIIRAVQDLSVPQSLLNNRLLTERKFPEIICQPHQDNLSDDEDEAMDEEGTGIVAPSVGLSDRGDNTEEMRLRDAEAEEQERKAIQDFGRDMDMTQLKSTLTCKICLTDLISIIFVPCGHLVCCTSCAAAMTSCPICRKEGYSQQGVKTLHEDRATKSRSAQDKRENKKSEVTRCDLQNLVTVQTFPSSGLDVANMSAIILEGMAG